MQVFSYTFLKNFYGFTFFIQVYDLYWVNFCIRHKVCAEVNVFVYGHLIVSVQFVEETILFPLNCLCFFVKTTSLYSCLFISGLYVLFHWSICLAFNNTMTSWLPWFYSKFWNVVKWVFWLSSSFLQLFCLF